MSIFTHVTVGANNLAKSKAFYDAALGALGVKNLGALGDRGVMWGKDGPQFLILKPADGKPATRANGGTVSFAAPNRKAVHAFHQAALANGGTCEGKPGRAASRRPPTPMRAIRTATRSALIVLRRNDGTKEEGMKR